MFKKIMISFVLTATAVSLFAAPSVSKSKIDYGNKQLYVLNASQMTMRTKNDLLMTAYAHFTTKNKVRWIAISNPVCKTKLLSFTNNIWTFESAVPVNAAETMPVKETLAFTQFGSLDCDINWNNPKVAGDLIERGYFITLPMASLKNSTITVNGKKLTVVKETKYGWYNAALENPEFVLYEGIAPFRIAFNGKYNVSIGSVKNNAVTIRVIAPVNAKCFKFAISE